MTRTNSTTRDISDTGFRCEPASNGGWVVWDYPVDQHIRSSLIGAFSSPEEMLSGLSTLLSHPADGGVTAIKRPEVVK